MYRKNKKAQIDKNHLLYFQHKYFKIKRIFFPELLASVKKFSKRKLQINTKKGKNYPNIRVSERISLIAWMKDMATC